MRRGPRSAIAVLTCVPLLLMLAAPGIARAEEPAAPEPQATLADRIVVAAEAGATPEEIAEAASLPAEGGGSLSFDAQERVVATVLFDGPPSAGTLAAVAEIAAVDRVLSFFPGAEVRVAPERIGELAAIPGVTSATPALQPFVGSGLSDSSVAGLREGVASVQGLRPAAERIDGTACGPIPIEADAPLRADLARASYGVDGTGVTIGIISDSFDQVADPTSFADDVASGALPGDGNPCGRSIPVEVLSDQRTGGSDEGRAMAQLVHGIAPGAKLLFADAGSSEFGMVENIGRLAEAGADIIVDDISWSSESYYQKGFISAAIERAKSEYGVAYFSSAGNSTAASSSGPNAGVPHSSWQTTAYRPMPCPAWVTVDVQSENQGGSGGDTALPAETLGLDCMDFDPDAGAEVAYDTLTMRQSLLTNEYALNVVGSVGEPMLGVSTQIAAQFYVESDGGATLTRVADVSMIGGPYAGFSGSATLPLNSTVRMVLVRTAHDETAPRLPAVFVQFMRGGDAIAERHFMGDGTNDWVGETTFGHAGDGSAISVGSAYWNDPTTMRDYSSLGPGTLLYEMASLQTPAPAARLAVPQIVDTPHITSVDGTQTTFFGSDEGEEGAPEYRFDGTSAAAPNAAAVAALGLSYRPQLTGAELSDLVVSTARTTIDGAPMVNPYAPRFADEHVFGAGLVDALGLVDAIEQLLPTPAVPAAPTGLAATDRKVDALTFAWNAPESPEPVLTRPGPDAPVADAPVDRYVITLFKGDPLPGNAIEASRLDDEPLPTSHTFTGLDPDTRYTVQLTAFADGDSTGASATAEARTLAKSDGGGGSGGTDGSGQQGSGTTNQGQLSKTGGENAAPWFAIGGLALVVVAAGLLLLARRRSGRGEGIVAADDAATGGDGAPAEESRS